MISLEQIYEIRLVIKSAYDIDYLDPKIFTPVLMKNLHEITRLSYNKNSRYRNKCFMFE